MPDDAAYLALMDRILAATTEQGLLALVRDILLFTGGQVTLDFGEAWTMRWRRVTGDAPVPAGFWPPG